MSRQVHIFCAGKLDYGKSLLLQSFFSKQLKENRKHFENCLILTEHDPVYTIGIRTRDYTIDDEQRLRGLGAQFFKTNRGGLITFHGHGQLVAYPILNLKNFNPSIRWYVCHLEKTIINLCKKYHITACTTSDTGVWVNDRKICAIGVHGSQYITSHGLALNCDIDLSWFDHIVPCGIEGKGVTSISMESHENISIKDVQPKFLNSFKEIFNCEFIEFTKDYEEKVFNEINKN